MWGYAVRSRILLTLLTLGAGFRADGTASYPKAGPPAGFDKTAAAWFAPMPTWGNASPVVFGELVCVTSEPTALHCVRKADGSPAFVLDTPVLEGLDATQRASIGGALEKVAVMEAELPTLLAEQSRLKRELRRSTDTTEIAEKLSTATTRVFEIQDELERLRAYRTPPDREEIGYATPTPVTDGSSLYAQFGNGVVTAVKPDGTRRWTRWLGQPTAQMHGYITGVTSSPLLVDGVLIVANNTLMGLDPATGATRWTGPEYKDYGTPALATVEGKTLLVTPAGEVIRPRDGTVLATGIGRVWFVGPHAAGNKVWYAGGTVTDGSPKRPIEASLRTLRFDGPDRIVADPVWSAATEVKERVYTTPVVFNDVLYVVDSSGSLFQFDANTGAVLGSRPTTAPTHHYASPIVLGDRLTWASERGDYFVRSGDGSVASFKGDGARSTPVWADGHLYVRGFSGLWAFKAAP